MALLEDMDVAGIATLSQIPILVLSLNTDVVERLAEDGVTPESPLQDRIQALRAHPGDAGTAVDPHIIIGQILTARRLDRELRPGDPTGPGRRDYPCGGPVRPGRRIHDLATGGAVGRPKDGPCRGSTCPPVRCQASSSSLASTYSPPAPFYRANTDVVNDYLACLEQARLEVIEGSTKCARPSVIILHRA